DKYSIKTTKKLVQELTFPKKPNILPPSFLLNEKHFLPEILIEILKIKQAIFSLPEVPEKDLMKLAFSNILLKSSNAQRFPSLDRKSTRLNSSHVSISYAVFCLKKKTEDCC